MGATVTFSCTFLDIRLRFVSNCTGFNPNSASMCRPVVVVDNMAGSERSCASAISAAELCTPSLSRFSVCVRTGSPNAFFTIFLIITSSLSHSDLSQLCMATVSPGDRFDEPKSVVCLGDYISQSSAFVTLRFDKHAEDPDGVYPRHFLSVSGVKMYATFFHGFPSLGSGAPFLPVE